jgi:hypothetical protein
VRGGDGFAFLADSASEIVSFGDALFDLFTDYVKEVSPVSAAPDGRIEIRFGPSPDNNGSGSSADDEKPKEALIIGVTVGVAGLVCIAAAFLLFRRRQKAASESIRILPGPNGSESLTTTDHH